ILSTMNTEICTLPPGLVAYYTFDEGIDGGTNSGLIALPDQSGNGNNGTLSGFALSGATSNWVSGQNLPGGSTNSSVNITVCDEYVSPSGNYTWNTSGSYHDTIPNSSGCDSMITINLTVTPVDVSLGMFGITLMANAINAYFQWVDCDNNYAHVPGAVFQQFTPTVNGNYACIVTQYGCADTTICVPITTVDVASPEAPPSLGIHPNPSPDGWVKLEHLLPGSTVQLWDITGQLLYHREFDSERDSRLFLPGPGSFFLKVIQGDTITNRQVVSLGH
ncbi:MAG TPA: T9SS type A sorting domain-containing protein, partial [Bacteroidales bacterium]|nr:T9SS type A sorting domain-containing protein [Bacteroidales bacterium]